MQEIPNLWKRSDKNSPRNPDPLPCKPTEQPLHHRCAKQVLNYMHAKKSILDKNVNLLLFRRKEKGGLFRKQTRNGHFPLNSQDTQNDNQTTHSVASPGTLQLSMTLISDIMALNINCIPPLIISNICAIFGQNWVPDQNKQNTLKGLLYP